MSVASIRDSDAMCRLINALQEAENFARWTGYEDPDDAAGRLEAIYKYVKLAEAAAEELNS